MCAARCEEPGVGWRYCSERWLLVGGGAGRIGGLRLLALEDQETAVFFYTTQAKQSAVAIVAALRQSGSCGVDCVFRHCQMKTMAVRSRANGAESGGWPALGGVLSESYIGRCDRRAR